MLQTTEVLPGGRRALRRAVHMECDVVCPWWDEPVAHRATNLSPQGIWLESQLPLTPGEVVVLSFTPPRFDPSRELIAFGTVRRTELRRRASDPRASGMGIEFLDLDDDEATELAAVLRGLPPPLPRRRYPRLRREHVWVDLLLTWDEDLGDRVNTFEVSERIGFLDDDDLDVTPLGELVTGGVPAHRWHHVA
jgi:hypothetical protein